MPTVAEVLKQSGWSEEEIKALDGPKMAGLTQVVTTATQTLEQAELAKRAQAQQYNDEIAPALNTWANEKAAYDAKIAAYDAALKSAKEGGFVVPEILAPPAAPRAGDGRFVANANPVPGSPDFVPALRKEAAVAISSMLDLNWKYQSLFGRPLPDSPTTLIAEATAQRLDPVVYAAKKYGFSEKEAQIKAEEVKKREDSIRAEVSAAKDKEWSEKVGSNPMVRQAETSRFANLEKAVKAGERPDPLKMNKEQRHVATRQSYLKEAAALDTVN